MCFCLYLVCNLHLLDIESAFGTGSYPEKLAYKLYLRKGFSLKELREPEKAIEVFRDFRHFGIRKFTATRINPYTGFRG